MTKLKPCPFCGCEDIGTGFEICRRVYFCNDCGVSVTAVDGDDGKVWNTRPGEDAAVKAERERCAAKIEWLASVNRDGDEPDVMLCDDAFNDLAGADMGDRLDAYGQALAAAPDLLAALINLANSFRNADAAIAEAKALAAIDKATGR